MFAIIFDDQKRVLLSHRVDHDLWNLPGGTLEAGEAPWEGVIREVEEETNLDIEVERLAGIYRKKHNDGIVFSFICKIIGGKLSTSNEADEQKYFSVNELPQNMPPKQMERIKDAVEKPTELIMKNQSGESSVELLKKGRL